MKKHGNKTKQKIRKIKHKVHKKFLECLKEIITKLKNITQIKKVINSKQFKPKTKEYLNTPIDESNEILGDISNFIRLFITKLVLKDLEKPQKVVMCNYWLVEQVINETTTNLNPEKIRLIKLLACNPGLSSLLDTKDKTNEEIIFDVDELNQFLRVNVYEGITYINKERWEMFLDACLQYRLFRYFESRKTTTARSVTQLNQLINRVFKLKKIAMDNGYDLKRITSEIFEAD